MPPKPSKEPSSKTIDPPRPTAAELEILTILWDRGASTVRDVHEEIASRKPTQYTTVLKMLQIMTEKGIVQRNEDARAHLYQASRPMEWTQRQLAGDLLERAFGGSPTSLMMGALASRKTSKKELAEIRKLLDSYEKASYEKAESEKGTR
jgi:BlaI family penicillinase repressor